MVPKIISPYLWYLDLKKVDLTRDKKRIILNVLNYGSREAISWLFSYYKQEEIVDIFKKHGAVGELSPKSLNYWCLMLDVKESDLRKSRFEKI